MEIIHYSRTGYNGGYNYTSVCGKTVKTHQEKESTVVHPEKANCKKCLSSQKYKLDLAAFESKEKDMERRIYIESNILHSDEFVSAQEAAIDFISGRGLSYVDRVFNDVLERAWHDLAKTWEAVKSADEIYATTSLVPLSNSYSGAPVIFNGMCERAVKENIKGKTVVIFNSLENISWNMINTKLMKQAFKENTLIMYNKNYDLVEIDITKIKDKK